jgi:hypothetical protein
VDKLYSPDDFFLRSVDIPLAGEEISTWMHGVPANKKHTAGPSIKRR